MVDVTDGADVAVRLVPLELFLGHGVVFPLVSRDWVGGGAVFVFFGSGVTLTRQASPRALATISVAMFPGTSSYRENCME